MYAVVVTETLDWKLHGFDLLSEHSLPVRAAALFNFPALDCPWPFFMFLAI